jgi:hypothetical protein
MSQLGQGGASGYQWVKQLGHEADHSLPSSVKIKNAWSFTSTLPCFFMAWCLSKRRICLYGVTDCPSFRLWGSENLKRLKIFLQNSRSMCVCISYRVHIYRTPLKGHRTCSILAEIIAVSKYNMKFISNRFRQDEDSFQSFHSLLF